MTKIKKLRVGILIIDLAFIFLYFSIQCGRINLNEETSGYKNNTPILSNGKSVSFKWSRTWGGDDWDEGYGVAVDSLANVYLAGRTESFGAGLHDMVLVKYDGDGVQQWNRTWGGGEYDESYGVALDSLGNVYLAGYTTSFGEENYDMVLVKYDENGVQQWNCTWGGGDSDLSYGVAIDSTDNVYLAGITYDFEGAGGYDMVLVKYYGNGTQQWNCTWGGGNYDYGYGVVVDSSDNVYLAGRTESFGAGGYDLVLVKYNENGTVLWTRMWGGINDDGGNGVVVDSLDNVYVAGYTNSFGAGNYDIVLIKYDGNGSQQWTRILGESDYDWGRSVAVDSLDNLYVVGSTVSFGAVGDDIILIKYDGNGVQQWTRIWGGDSSEIGSGVAMDSLDNVYLAGGTRSFGVGNYDIILVKFSNAERQPFEDLIWIIIIIVSIASAVGVGIVVIYFVRKRRNMVE